jgi:hypothetical protein
MADMASAHIAADGAERSSAEIRAALEKILSTKLFLGSERRTSLLRYLVEETIAGRSASIKEYTIGLEVFGKAPTYDPRLDPIVRVEIGRLRQKLKKYYDTDGIGDRLRIELPKGSYQLNFVQLEAPPPRRSRTRLLWTTAAAGICVTIGLAGWTWHRKSQPLARVLYQSGFEAPAYSVGQLTGQDGWMVAPIAVEGYIAVQSGTASTGRQAVQIVAAGARNMTRASHLIKYDSKVSYAKTVAISVDVQLSSDGTPSVWELITAFGRGEPNNFLAFLAVKSTGELFLRQREGTSVNTGVFLTRGVWNHVELDFNFGADNMDAHLNGRKIVSGWAFEDRPAGNLWKAGFEISYGPVGTDTAYFDNFSVSAVP